MLRGMNPFLLRRWHFLQKFNEMQTINKLENESTNVSCSSKKHSDQILYLLFFLLEMKCCLGNLLLLLTVHFINCQEKHLLQNLSAFSSLLGFILFRRS